MISGGGTGGHVFPAIAIAEAIKKIQRDAKFLFVGAEGKLEMTRVPAAGFEIIGLPIRGFQRKITLKNVGVAWKLLESLWMTRSILKKFHPDVVVGVGGYASGAMLRAAAWGNIPILIQEQNSYPGLTNKLMAKHSNKICVAFEGMERFFPKDKLVLTGNPVRQDLTMDINREDAYKHFGLSPDKKTICVLGGSLGARTLNSWVQKHVSTFYSMPDVQILWQVGTRYLQEFEIANKDLSANIVCLGFINRMDYVYAVADVAITRAGALTISELMVTQTPSILIPSPNVAEDHQRKNAEALIQKGAAKMVLDKDVNEKLWDVLINLLKDLENQHLMRINLKEMAKPNASLDIANEIVSLINK